MDRRPASAQLRIAARSQARLLASPARQEILDALEASGPCTIADVGEQIGRAPDSLYFHVRQLLRAGLLVERGRRASGRRPAAIYDVPGRPLTLDYRALAPADLTPIVSAALRLGRRDFARGFHSPRAVRTGANRNLWGGRVKGWVGPREAAEVHRLLRQVARVLRRREPGGNRHLLAFTFVMAPVEPRSRGGGPKGARR